MRLINKESDSIEEKGGGGTTAKVLIKGFCYERQII